MVVDVAAAVVLRADGAFLLAQRPPGKVYAGWWEFPGGKIEAGEAPERALARELHEELGIDVVRAYPWLTRVFTYAHATVRLHFFRVLEIRGEPHGREGQAFTWQLPGAAKVGPMLPANAPVLRSLALPHEYAVSDAETMGVDAFLGRLEARLATGLRMVQLRDKTISDRAAFACRVVDAAHRHGARVMVNGEETLARSLGADGVHLPSDALMLATARPVGMMCAASCHSAEEFEQAARLECDFAVIGPVRDTASHPGARTLGWEGFGEIARGAPLPIYAIGGMRPEDMERAWMFGAHGLAMIRGSWETG
ncbi:MAG: Nudix family hydrolase [Betaproteobacteria bacterium]|nr:Nudix family hydrolase [Betaproteobacteria bacterium]